MKTNLTKEQSQHLIDLGVPKEKASIKNIDEIVSTGTGVNDERYIWSYQFTITDILEILPKEIDADKILMIEYSPTSALVYYRNIIGLRTQHFVEKEHIDALYELCVWCLKNKYLKLH